MSNDKLTDKQVYESIDKILTILENSPILYSQSDEVHNQFRLLKHLL